MKRNRIAAGALALAMGLGAVAPSFAAEAPKAEAKKELKSTELFQEQYKSLLERTNKERNDYMAAKSAYDTADSELKAAKDKLAKEYAAYEEIINPIGERINAYKNAVARAEEELNLHSEFVVEQSYTEEKITYIVKDGVDSLGNPIYRTKTETVKVYKPLPTTAAKEGHEAEFEVAKERLENAQRDLEDIKSKVASASEQLQRVKAAEGARDVAQTNFNKAEEALAKHLVNGQPIWEKSLAEVKAASEGYNVTVQATEKGVVVVDKNEDTDNKGVSEAELAKLRKSVENAKVRKEAVKIVKSTAKNISAKNAEYLDKLVADAEKLIEKGEAVLKANEKKAAFSVFSTAYASEEEEEVTDEDVRALTEELDAKTKEMEEAIKKVDEAEGEADEEEKPADKEEEKTPAKEEEKPAVKEDTTAKSAVKSSANRTAGRNAKTGIAGVAGVAGVLAAASVAYAASKKNN